MVQLFQEPQVDFCDLMNFLAGNAPAQGFKDDEETLVILIVQFLGAALRRCVRPAFPDAGNPEK